MIVGSAQKVARSGRMCAQPMINLWCATAVPFLVIIGDRARHRRSLARLPSAGS
jgi:hypothetical protein